jgi:hypothetical protein
MRNHPSLRTRDLALAGHISVQHVRKNAGQWLDPARTAESEQLSPLHPASSCSPQNEGNIPVLSKRCKLLCFPLLAMTSLRIAWDHHACSHSSAKVS